MNKIAVVLCRFAATLVMKTVGMAYLSFGTIAIALSAFSFTIAMHTVSLAHLSVSEACVLSLSVALFVAWVRKSTRRWKRSLRLLFQCLVSKSEALAAFLVERKSIQELDEWYWQSPGYVDQYTGIWAILKATHPASAASCQRSILELCALKMTNKERCFLLGDVQDDLSIALRKPTVHVPWLCWEKQDKWHQKRREQNAWERLMHQRWFRLSNSGQNKTITTIYWTIQSNPNAFCRMVAARTEGAVASIPSTSVGSGTGNLLDQYQRYWLLQH